MPEPLMATSLDLPGRRQGKVRDLYEATLDAPVPGAGTPGTPVLLIVATDRISAFDVVMPNGISGKGVILTQISRFWFDMIAQRLGGRLEHHLLATDAGRVQGLTDEQREQIRGRVTVGRKTRVVPIECVVRGYLAGSGWKEYQQSGTVCGISLPPNLPQCAKLDQPIFTPATKAETGHDENVSFEEACAIAGKDMMERLRELSLAIYTMAHDYAQERGILIADTKFEFGVLLEGASDQPILIDEALTPDSSRFWPADSYEPGRDQASFDKQYVRNYLETLVEQGRWDKMPPAPTLPDEIVANTRAKYLEAYRRLTGQELEL